MRRKAVKPVPVGCREYGVPFISKTISQKIHELQHHDFKFDEEKPEIHKCKSGNEWFSCDYTVKAKPYTVCANYGLKEFLMKNPPDFAISKKCCDGAKKNTAKAFYKETDCYLSITGERRAEGGIRATEIHSCFEARPNDKVQRYRPLFFWTDDDKQQYKEHYGLRYSDCYEVYGMTRTGCAGCPFNSKFEEDLKVIEQYEPKLYQAANNIFGKSYEYTRAYRKFKEEMKARNKK